MENSFYLTGGTALHRFYYDYRLSDDLDFFTNQDILFYEYIRDIFNSFDHSKINCEIKIREKDFVRIKISDELKVDFVNDIGFRYGKSTIIKNYKIDNIFNILTNKIGAIIGRDSEKDIFDLACICLNENFNWKEAIKIAQKKLYFEKEFFIYRLKTFPLEWLNNIKMLKPLMITKIDIDIIITDIKLSRENTLITRRDK